MQQADGLLTPHPLICPEQVSSGQSMGRRGPRTFPIPASYPRAPAVPDPGMNELPSREHSSWAAANSGPTTGDLLACICSASLGTEACGHQGGTEPQSQRWWWAPGARSLGPCQTASPGRRGCDSPSASSGDSGHPLEKCDH